MQVLFPDPNQIIGQLANPENWEFRSHSLLGHPLANAMTVSTILMFIILDNRIKSAYKLIYFLLGYFALFCFNARGAIMVVSLLLIPLYFFKEWSSANIYKKKLIIIVTVLTSLVFVYQIVNSSLGGRLFNAGTVIDGSAETRVNVFSAFNYISDSNLIWGNSENYLTVTNKLNQISGAAGIENGEIVMVLKYGFIFTPLFIIFLFRFLWQKLIMSYSLVETLVLFFTFVLIGTMNPNLSQPVQWMIFIFSYYAFRNPMTLNQNRKQLSMRNSFK